MRFPDAVEKFLFFCSVERKLSAHTVQAYKSDLRAFGRVTSTKASILDIKADDIRHFLAHMIENRNLSAATARRRVACLKSFFKYCAEELGVEGPFREWSPSIKRPQRLPRALDRSDVQKLLGNKSYLGSSEAIEGLGHLLSTQFTVALIALTGIRVSELCAIRLCDVASDGASIGIDGKGAKERRVYITDDAVKGQLLEIKRRRAETGKLDDPLFVNSRGGPMTPQTFRRRLRHLAVRSDIGDRVTPHMLRHTAATLLIEGGVDIRFVQRLLGHASIATTEIYTKVTDESLRRRLEEANVLENLL